MDLTEKLNLVGYFEGESKQRKSIDEVADFICQNGKHGDVTIMNNGELFIQSLSRNIILNTGRIIVVQVPITMLTDI